MGDEQIEGIMTRLMNLGDNLKGEILSAKIIIADDMSIMRKLIGGILNAAGFKNLYFAENGKEALELAYQIDPDLLILDLNMPNM